MSRTVTRIALLLLPSLLLTFSPNLTALAADGLVEVRLLGSATFTRAAKAPADETRTFLVKRPVAQSYLLRLEASNASTAEVALNGLAIFTPSDFPLKPQKGTALEREVAVGASNDLTVTLGGKPGDSLTLTVIGLYDPADVDNDGDGITEREGDCNDADGAIFPGAPEVCGDNKDNNCDGAIDEGCFTNYYRDADADGFGDARSVIRSSAPTPPAGYSRNGEDCNDSNPAVNPRSTEICGDGLDNNCDGVVDGPNCPRLLYFDGDRDGFGDPRRVMAVAPAALAPVGYVTVGGDCNDANPMVNPGAREICGDRLDNNCNGTVDEGCP